MNQTGNIASAYSPPFKIVAKYFIAGIIAFILLNLLLLFNYEDIGGHHFQPKILSITHIATLGWITMIIFGAMFQLVPVILEVKLFSSKLAEIQFWIFAAGIIGLVYKFWHFNSALSFTAPAILINLAMYIFIFNIIATMKSVRTWNLTGTYLAAALFYLFVTAVAGLLLAANLDHPYIRINHLQYLNLHAHVAFIGWVSMVVMGVTYKLIPMFTLSHNFKLTLAKIAFVLINIGLLGISTIMHYSETTIFYYIFVPLIAVGIILFLFQVLEIFKKRIRKKFDVGIKFSSFAYIILGITTLLGTVIAFIDYQSIINLTLIYGYIIIFGYLSMLIVGQMYKIVPFLVWYHKYSSKVGFENVPMLKDMFNEKIALIEFYFMMTGLILATISFSFQINQLLLVSFFLMLISSVIFATNMIKIFWS
ncbi:cbb3-type cytochrome c oxidase subunit I [Melioribacteraceae bacterium 4301-Me]|uniref:cbb3-type cytochrome c oxidase subunit I n=1 Tax=Pyranulibacter aquaticus TaxID=3163344 RepID=UPI003598AF77